MNNCPKVSFIVLNCSKSDYLDECFKSIKSISYPEEKKEYIFLDNESNKISVKFNKENFKNVRIVKYNASEGFAKANNAGANAATGEYLAIITSDIRVDKNWLKYMLETLENSNDETYVCVGSKILNDDGTKLEFSGRSVSFDGQGLQFNHDTKLGTVNEDKDVLFASSKAMIIKKSVFQKIEGFDEDFFYYNEDLDLGWRLWTLGYKVRFSSKSLCYNHDNLKALKYNKNKIEEIMDRNALFTIYKNYADDKMYKILLSSLIIKMYETCDSQQNGVIKDFIDKVDKIRVKREHIQNERKIEDKVIIDKFMMKPYSGQFTKYNNKNNLYNTILNKLISGADLKNIFGVKKNSVLIVSSGSIGEKMAGPGIRYFEISKELSKICDVTLAVPNDDCKLEFKECNIEVFSYGINNFERLKNEFLNNDIIIVQGVIFEVFPILKSYCDDRIIIVDLYDPFVIENLEIHKRKSITQREEIHNVDLNMLIDQIKIGDYFLCASEKQKDFWIGMLVSFNRINPKEYELSNTLEKLIGFLPFGIANQEPFHNREALKEKIPDLKSDDKVFIWGGGVWNWFDPLTVIRAIHNISKYRDDIKLFFLGVKHPNPDVPEMEMLNTAFKLAEELGVRGKNVFFNMDWVDYNDRQNFLMESYAGVSSHFDSLETRFSFRTRVLDYLWAEMPIITTEGDYFADEVENKKLGIVVKYKDVANMESALVKICDDKAYYTECKKNIKEYRKQFKWQNVTKDLKEFCINPIKKENQSKQANATILDVCQQENNDILKPLYYGRTVIQEFVCRYPNLNKIEFRIGTYGRINEGKLIFKLYEKLGESLIYEEEVELSKVEDSNWHKSVFSPIINSEGREFYFKIEASQDVSMNNAFTLFYSTIISEYGFMYYNDVLMAGNLSFKTSCILTNKRLSEKDGVTISDGSDISYLINNIHGISKMEKEKLLEQAQSIEEHREKSYNESIKALNKSVIAIGKNLQGLNDWEKVMNHRVERLKKLNIFKAIKKIFIKK